MKKKLHRERFGKVYAEMRERIVRAIDADPRGYMSPNELSKGLGEGLSQVSYHVKVLKEYGCIKLKKTEPRRGAVEHYYELLDGILLEPEPEEAALHRIAALVPKNAGRKGVMGQIASELRRVGFDPNEIDGEALAEAA